MSQSLYSSPPETSKSGDAPAAQWIKILRSYRSPSMSRSWFEILVTILPFIALWGAAVWATSISVFLALPICVAAGFFLVRLFLIQHDCSHGAFFNTRSSNDMLGRVIGVLTITPYDLWRQSHLAHHAKHGNLTHRGMGDVLTLTVDEYNARSYWGRLSYRLYRHPIVLFGIGPAFIFMLHHRLPVGFMKAGPRYWISTMGTNAAIAAIVVCGIAFLGLLPFLMTYLVILTVAATIGVWLFYVQHQFEDTVWDHDEDWQLHDAALYGSSHYVLPPFLQWMTANIGIHHVHHLYSRIPFYRLHQVLRDHPELAKVRRMTFVDSLKTTRLKLWCERQRRLVGWKAARAGS